MAISNSYVSLIDIEVIYKWAISTMAMLNNQRVASGVATWLAGHPFSSMMFPMKNMKTSGKFPLPSLIEGYPWVPLPPQKGTRPCAVQSRQMVVNGRDHRWMDSFNQLKMGYSYRV